MSQINLFGADNDQRPASIEPGVMTEIANGRLLYQPGFFDRAQSNAFFNELRQTVEWAQESMLIYGKRVNFPRLTAWYGDNDKPYSFSGITLRPKGWLPALVEIRTKLEALAGTSFNSVLLNLYRNGNDSISWHTDAEPELGIDPIIGSVNFGQARVFQLRHRLTKEKLEIELAHGSVLVMEGELQHHWQHQVPKSNKPMNERINLTFRTIKTP